MEDFVTFEMAKTLKEKGFNEKCLFAYNDEQVINPKIVEEYGNLTDDGYYELTEDCGGKLKFDNVYIYEQQIILRDKIIIERNFIDAPTISQVLKWLREEKNFHLMVYILNDSSEDADGRIIQDWFFWSFGVQNCNSGDYAYGGDDVEYESYEKAALAGIEYVLDNLL